MTVLYCTVLCTLQTQCFINNITLTCAYHKIKDDRMENSVNGRRIQNNLRYHGGCARAALARPFPPHCTPTQGGCEMFVFVISRNFRKFFLFYFAKFKENFVKHEIKNFAKYENENFAATLLLHNLLSAFHPPLPSARRIFNVALQCYFEVKTNTEPYFSILSSLILWCICIFNFQHYTGLYCTLYNVQLYNVQLYYCMYTLPTTTPSCDKQQA